MKATLSSILPKPKNQDDENENDEVLISQAIKHFEKNLVPADHSLIPKYGDRKNWIPRKLEDFGDGGAYPEINIVQFPHNMGKTQKVSTSNAIPASLDDTGNINYETLLKGLRDPEEKVIHSKFSDLIPLAMRDEADLDLSKPSQDDIEKNTEATKLALEKITDYKISTSIPIRRQENQEEPDKFIRYTPVPSLLSNEFNSGAEQRVIKMTEAKRDPMSPPRFRINAKVPMLPKSPPAPIMHSPPRKLTKEEREDWNIPTCISNWKNPHGYVIPLDKRLATDGRALQDPHINDKFAKFAEALYIADRKAREAVEMRAQMEKRVIQKEKEQKEQSLKLLAQKSRNEKNELLSEYKKDTDEIERDRLREDRRYDRERERKIAQANERRGKPRRDKERDISEKIALGKPVVQQNFEAQFDQRLFNQTQGMDSGFHGGEDDIYNIYDQPFKKVENKSALYKPSKDLDDDMYGQDIETIIKTSRFVSEKGLSANNEDGSVLARTGPVQFEMKEKLTGSSSKKNNKQLSTIEDDPFELDKFLSEAKSGKRQKPVSGNDINSK